MNKTILDEIVEIKYLGEEETLDINVSGNRLFYANDILTHNSAVEEIEFDHSHISGGLSKIMTADNVIGIFTSRAMRERGKFQIQFMKTRSSSGVGHKVDLDFDIDTLRITDNGEDQGSIREQTNNSVYQNLKKSSNVTESTQPRLPDQGSDLPKINPSMGPAKLRSILASINPERDDQD